MPAEALRGQGLYPKLNYGLAPYVATSLFDPNAPLQADLGLRFSARYDIAPGLFLSGALTKKLAGTIDSKRLSNSIARHKVRSDAALYATQGDPALETLTLAWFAKPSGSLYTRVTAGYLEAMYAGLSTEVLWQQVNKPYALGLELNYVKQRDFDQRFGLQSYSSLNGHISGYYDLRNGFQAQLDVGRYLAGDVGATLSLDREFPMACGWGLLSPKPACRPRNSAKARLTKASASTCLWLGSWAAQPRKPAASSCGQSPATVAQSSTSTAGSTIPFAATSKASLMELGEDSGNDRNPFYPAFGGPADADWL